jgi:hypothetical protein
MAEREHQHCREINPQQDRGRPTKPVLKCDDQSTHPEDHLLQLFWSALKHAAVSTKLIRRPGGNFLREYVSNPHGVSATVPMIGRNPTLLYAENLTVCYGRS